MIAKEWFELFLSSLTLAGYFKLTFLAVKKARDARLVILHKIITEEMLK
ncbi:MAG TPA: hypothetical protein VIE65_07295 [Methylobacter sp.]